MSRLPVDELLRLACIYAERDQEEFARCIAGCDAEKESETAAFIKQLREYRMKRWGKTALEGAMDAAVPVSIHEFFSRATPNSDPPATKG